MAKDTEVTAKSTATLSQRATRNIVLSMVLLAILVAAAVFAYRQSDTGMNEIGKLYSEQNSLERFRASLSDILLPMNDFTLTGNPSDMGKMKSASDNFRRLYTEVSTLSSLEENDSRELKEVSDLMKEVITISEDIVSGKIPPEQAKNIVVVAQSLVFVAQEKMNEVVKRQGVRLDANVASARAQNATIAAINLGLIVALVLILILFNRNFVNSITGTISDVAVKVTGASDDILNSVDQQSAATDTQAMSVSAITEELEQMTAAAKKIAVTASSVEKIADATAASATEGVQAVMEAIGYLDRIRDEVNAITEKVTFAGEKVEQILDFVDSIKDIADETHLLALNASIESAAAGEFGKRFAVVAGEVRRLSERAREFTDQIQNIVNDVHAATRSSVEVTQAGLQEVAKGVEITKRASEALTKMQSMSEKTSQAVRTIAQATNRQDASNREFLMTMQQIAELFQDTAAQMQRTRETTNQLTVVADELKRLV